MPNDVRVYGATIKDELNPDLWSGTRLKDNIRNALIKVAEKFYEFIKTDMGIVDIQLTGTSASYNWTASSDIDIHLIFDFSKFSNNKDKQEVLRRKFDSQKRVFNELYDIEIYGHDVNIYVDDVDDVNINDGIFSLKENLWVRKPKSIEVDVNRERIQKRSRYFMNLIDRLEYEESDSELFNKAMLIKDEIINMKYSELEKEGNFSVGNLVFKSLKESGYISKLFEYIKDSYSSILSLKEGKESKSILLLKEELTLN